MPLSEHEQRLLEQMERALYAEDPKFATSMRSPRPSAGDRRRVALGVLVFLLGIGMLLSGVASQLVVVGVLGFVAMLGGIWLAVMAMRAAGPAGTSAQPAGHADVPPPTPITRSRPRVRRSHSSGSLSERMEQRWRRRRERGEM